MELLAKVTLSLYTGVIPDTLMDNNVGAQQRPAQRDSEENHPY